MTAFVDTHLHLSRDEFAADRDAVVARARAAGVAAFLHVGYDRATIAAATELARAMPASWASAGIHPHDASDYDAEIEAEIARLARAGEIVAIGECGLDFFRDLSPRDAQDHAFRAQIRLATEVDLPMIFHVRDAYDEARATLIDAGLPPRRGVFHAFAGDADFARWATDEGFCLGIGGPLTYKNSKLPDSIAGLPTSAFLLETDAPWLPPQPWRGKRNEPGYLATTARRLAELCGVSVDEIAAATSANFERIFGVQLPGELRALQPSQCDDPAG